MRYKYPIPSSLNLFIALVQVLVLTAILWKTSQASSWQVLLLLSFCYGIVMNSSYALLHEAEHNLLHHNPLINQSVGVILALFFPAPFHLIRQGHIGHHMRNRSDDEAFDVYFKEDNALMERLRLYSIMIGGYWLLVFLSIFYVLFKPDIIKTKYIDFDRPTRAFIESLNPKYKRLIQLESLSAIVLHGSMIYFWNIAILDYFIVLFGFGFMWSAMQYVHHYGTERDVRKGAVNLKTFKLLDLIWLNHNWHLNHHMHPTIPWLYLPKLYSSNGRRESLIRSYLRMWKGPILTNDHVENCYSGKIIK
jgi:fatty acid desaturase